MIQSSIKQRRRAVERASSPEILILSPDFPPKRGGVADHTERLAIELNKTTPTEVLTSQQDPGITDFSVHSPITSWRNHNQIANTVRLFPECKTIIWQYVPHMYGLGGVNPNLAKAMRMLRRMGKRQILIAHEIRAPFSPWPHQFYYALSHRLQWRQIAQQVDVIGVSTEAWLEKWFPDHQQQGSKYFLCPSPSNIPVVPTPENHGAQWRRRNNLPEEAILIGFFGLAGSNKQIHWLLKAAEEIAFKKLPAAFIFLGIKKSEIPGVNRFSLPTQFMGYMSQEEISQALQTINLMTLPYIDGVSERRGAFMACLEHGCHILTTTRHSTGSTLNKADYIHKIPADNYEAFKSKLGGLVQNPKTLYERNSKAKAAYKAKYSWDAVTKKLRHAVSRNR